MADPDPANGADRIAAAFSGRRAALMPYLMGGFPSLAGSLEVGRIYAEFADLVELGVPFSDPLADGPAIQAAGQRALEQGATFERVLDDVAAPLAREVPVVAMCYANPLLARGTRRAVGALADRGVSGLIVPDMPAAEAGDLRAECDTAGIALVPLVAPTTPPGEVQRIAEHARGFVYVVSVTGVTGERAALPAGLADVVAQVRQAADVPVAVGFGIGTPEQVGAVAGMADGVIVGTRLVRAMLDTPEADGFADIREFLADCAKRLDHKNI